jgi:hypothetical protein
MILNTKLVIIFLLLCSVTTNAQKIVKVVSEIENTKDTYKPPLESNSDEPTFKLDKAALPETEKNTRWIDTKDVQELENPSRRRSEKVEKFHWKPALVQSGIFLGFQHGFRLAAQKSTRSQLGGPFFRDWGRTIKSLRGWRDGNKFYINYIGHPLQGGLTGRIFVNNSDAAKKQEFGKSKKYWESRFKALAWSTFWSTQFELGPISEANIGNVGLRPSKRSGGYSPMGYVDLVVTPVVGTGVLIGEDAIDKYILRNWLERKGNKTKTQIKFLRTVLTPTTSIGNLLRGKVPWKRDAR